jgi:cytochrome P450
MVGWRHRTEPRLPPGPRANPLLGNFLEFNRDRAGFLTHLAREYGDIVQFRLGLDRFVLLNHPDYVRDVLITHQANFHKGRALTRAKRLMGEGLLTSEEEVHLRQRRLMQPAFHRERLAVYGDAMVEQAARLTQQWQDGATVDIREEMTRLTLGIVCRALFNADVDREADAAAQAFSDLMKLAPFLLAPFSEYLEKLPLPQSWRFRQARARLDRIVFRIIRQRRESSQDRDDLLSMLLAAEDVEGGTGRMADQQVRDECMTLFVAGHETLANTLTWTWYLLSKHATIETRLQQELNSVLQDRLPTIEDLARLPFTEMVLSESMRLYPPAWFLGRRSLRPYEIGGFTIPRGSLVVLSQYVMHRDPRYYPDPERFDPQRWTPEARASRPKFAYFPFGAGVRQCIGDSFAWTEARLVLAVVAQRWRMRLALDHPVEIQAVGTLRPKHGMRMTLQRRRAG